MPVGALIGGGIGLIGSGISAYGAQSAANTQSQAALQGAQIQAAGAQQAAQLQYQSAQNALAFQQQVYNNNQGVLSPYINTGNQAQYSLASLYGLNGGGSSSVNSAFDAFTKLPAYQFPYQQGMQALNYQLNAEGKQQSGAQARASQQFGQGLASTYLMSNYVNPLMALSGQGQNAATSLANSNNAAANTNAGINATLGSQVGQSYQNAANASAAGVTNSATAQAAGTVGSANAFAGGINNLATYSALAYGGGTYSLGGGVGNLTGNSSAVGAGTDAQYNNWALQNGLTRSDIGYG